jgi:hypothetical protein
MNIPIRLNMGTKHPQGQMIGKREVYVYQNGENYELWIGDDTNDGNAVALTVISAESAKAIDAGKVLTVSGNRVSIGGLGYKSTNVVGSGEDITLSPAKTQDSITIKSITIDDVKKIIVDKDNYGKDLPETGIKGQLFFKI